MYDAGIQERSPGSRRYVPPPPCLTYFVMTFGRPVTYTGLDGVRRYMRVMGPYRVFVGIGSRLH